MFQDTPYLCLLTQLVAWYTPADEASSTPNTNSQVVNHFKTHSPIVPIALKWSQMDGGRAVRRDTAIDIPLTYDMPHFIADDTESEDPLHGHFILVLQGFLCHQGTKPDSGHYISATRCQVANEGGYQWLLNDDLASPRISTVEDIQQLLKKQKPYLLFYQVEPISALGEPPAYSESVSTDPYVVDSLAGHSERPSSSSEMDGRQSLDATVGDNVRGRSSATSERRNDLSLSNNSTDNRKENQAPITTVEVSLNPQSTANLPQLNARAHENGPSSKPNGRVNDKRSSMSLSRMAGRLTKGKSSTSLSGMEQSPAQGTDSSALDASENAGLTKSHQRKSHHMRNNHTETGDRRECILM